MSVPQKKDDKIYVMVNKENGAKITCTEAYLVKWLSMGFEVESIREGKLVDWDN